MAALKLSHWISILRTAAQKERAINTRVIMRVCTIYQR